MNELFELNTPECISSRGRRPLTGSNVTYFPSKITEDGVELHDDPWVKWKNRGSVGVFKETVNLIDSPEDPTQSIWLKSRCSAEMTDIYFKGKRFCKVTANNNSGANYLRQNSISLTSGYGSSSVVLMRGTSTLSRFRVLRESDDYNVSRIAVDWTKAPPSIYADTGDGVLVKGINYGNDIVEIFCTSPAPSTTTYKCYILTSYSSDTDYAYCTMPQVENSIYPTPYTSTSRSAGKLIYPKSLTNAGTIECWVRPWFGYDTTEYPMVFTWAEDTNNRFEVYYNSDEDAWVVYYRNSGGTGKLLYGTTVYTDNDDLRKWIHLKVVWDIDLGTGALIVNGVTEDNTWSDVFSSPVVSVNSLSIGIRKWGSTYTYPFDGLITDFAFKPYIDTSDDHYRKGRPYYLKDKIIGENCNWSIG